MNGLFVLGARRVAVAVLFSALVGQQASAQISRAPEAPKLRLVDVSMDGLIAAGSSSASSEELEGLQGGGHDPKKKGFTLQQAELSLAGAVDPYFTAEAHIVFTEDAIELEEVFAQTTGLPGGLQLKAGHFLTEFGRINPTHPHAWKWMDQPVINSRFFGGDGTRAPGVRLAWLTPLPWYSRLFLGAQNADNETAASFLGEAAHSHGEEEHAHEEEHEGEEEGEHEEHAEFEETIGGWPRTDDESEDLMYLVRWENAGDLSDEVNALFGLSFLTGPNAAGADTQTKIYGADLTVKWKPTANQRGWPFVVWQTEIMKRDYETGDAQIESDDGEIEFAATTLKDWGLYSQLLWGFTPGWSAGLRYEYATGDGEGEEPRDEDAARNDRTRISPLLAYQPSEFSRIRLQYNYDDADHLEDGHAHTVWLGLEFMYGSHPAHSY